MLSIFAIMFDFIKYLSYFKINMWLLLILIL